MDTAVRTSTASLHSAIIAEGFAFVQGAAMRGILAPYGSLVDWSAFAASWKDLQLDTYMADGGRYRRRRHAAYEASPGGAIRRKPHQPHYQAIEYNPLHGGVARWFEPIKPEIGESQSLSTILAFCHSTFDSLSASSHGTRAATARTWHVEVHQFRIEARPDEQGRPTPEGLHRDGVDYVLVLLINRQNIARGVTAIHSLEGQALGHFTLTDPLDAAIVDDRRVAHGVTPVEPLDSAKPAYRDVLVITFVDSSRRHDEPRKQFGS